MHNRILFAGLLLATSCLAADEPAVIASASESQLFFVLPPTHLESLCGADLFGIESRKVGDIAWMCASADSQTGRLTVANWGYLDTLDFQIVRGPIAGDRGVIALSGEDLVRLDPVTLERSVLGTLSPPVGTVNRIRLIDVPPGVGNALLLDLPDGLELRSYPGGAFIRTVVPWPQDSQRFPAGHFLSPQATLLATQDQNGTHLIDPATGASVPTNASFSMGSITGVSDWPGGGIDGMFTIGDQFGTVISADLFTTAGSQSIGQIQDGFVQGIAPVTWVDGEKDLIGIWQNTLRVFDPASGAVRHSEDHLYTPVLGNPLIWAVDTDADNQQEVYWTLYGDLYYLPHGAPSREAQMASAGFQVAGVSGTQLITAEKFASYGDSRLDIVVRDTRTLAVESRRTSTAPVDSQIVAANIPGHSAAVLFTFGSSRIAAETSDDGTPLWEIDNDPNQTGNLWSRFALPAGSCTANACAQMLVASNAYSSNTTGAYLQLLDTSSGSVLWQSEPQGGLGGGNYWAVALGDLNGDGVADIVSVRPDFQSGSNILQALDGVTHESLWSTGLSQNTPFAIGLTAKGTPRVAVLQEGIATLLDGVHGGVITTQPADTTASYYGCEIQFDPFVHGEGVWIVLGGTSIQWLDADFSAPPQLLDARGAGTEVSRGRGAVFAAGIEGIYRIQFPRDDVFFDEMGD